MENLDNIIANAYGSILIGRGQEHFLGDFNNILRTRSLENLSLPDIDESAESRDTIQQEEHVVTFVNVIQEFREYVHDFSEFR